MNCNSCIRILPLPECINELAYNPYYMDGLIFDDTDTNMIAKFRNTATGRMVYVDFTTENDGAASIDLATVYPLLDHVYEVHFVNAETGNPETFTIFNADSTTETGCCIEFGINPGQHDSNGIFIVSSQSCQV